MGSMSEEPLPPGYPAEWEADVVLRDGTVAHLRPIRPSDVEGIHRFHAAQSDESIYLRFFAPLRRLSDADVHRFTHVDYVDRVALVATMREDIIGIGRYDRIDARSAEVAFNISDHFQGKGIGSVLLEHLAAIAREVGIARFTAEVLPQNRKMLAVFSDAGYDVTRHVEDGVVEVGFDIEPTDTSKAVAMSREHRAEALSLRSILHPRTIAVVGASRRRDSIGSQLLERLVEAGFTGVRAPGQPQRPHPAPSHRLPLGGRRAGHRRPRRRGGAGARGARGRRRVRGGGGQGAAGRVLGLRRGGPRRGPAPGRAPAPGARRRHARRRAQLVRPHQQRPRGAAQRLPRADASAARAARAVRPVRGARHRRARLGGPSPPRHLDLRVRRQPGRRLRQRLHAVLDRRRLHRRRGPLPRVDGQPAQVLEDRPQPRPHQAGRRRQVGGVELRRAARAPGEADQGAAGGVQGDAQAGRRHPGRERAPALRRRPARRPPAAARGRPGGRRRQLHGARHAHRRRVHELGAHRDPRTGQPAQRGDGEPSSAPR